MLYKNIFLLMIALINIDSLFSMEIVRKRSMIQNHVKLPEKSMTDLYPLHLKNLECLKKRRMPEKKAAQRKQKKEDTTLQSIRDNITINDQTPKNTISL